MESLRDKYTENTRQALLDTGLRLFVERGYDKVSAEVLVRAAGLSRGALYGHFGGKSGLFEAIFNDLESHAAQRIRAAIDAVSDPFERVDRGVAVFLDVCGENDYRQIVMVQGPIALGWERWRELDKHHLGSLLLAAVDTLRESGLVKPYPADLIARAFFGSLTELCLGMAEAEDPVLARRQAADLIHDLIGGLMISDRP
ncbi:TetR/AcrR family transcriptional regulator [Nocardia sp. NPDC058176]|uniref:TetR/AcrR family transcriptional regulator n=1 Tax=Nocardia sp. NPDC058176 TaxID=3346368 RepID=UPI0036DC0EAE